MRREFQLLSDDLNFLESRQEPWETVVDGAIKRVILCNHRVPPGYNLSNVDLYIRIDATYPDTQIDMVYFYPHLVRSDGKPIKATINDSFDGKTWQRWSRHRTSANPWRPEIDNLSTHISLVGEWLHLELKKT